MRQARVILVSIAILLAVWLAGGLLHADAAARGWFANIHQGQSLVNVEVDGIVPVIPPFWQVTISGDVIEPGKAEPAYRSYMIVWIEPITGFGLTGAAG